MDTATFDVDSKVKEGVRFTFRRLTVAQAATMRLEIISATSPHLREVERLRATGLPDEVAERYSATAVMATSVPITIKHTLKSVKTGTRAQRADEFLEDPETSEDLMIEAYHLAQTGVRLSAEELGNWLSRGTLPPPETGNATNTSAVIVSESDSIKRETAGDTSPRA